MLELTELRLFAKVAETGTLSGAARILGIPKSSASRSLSHLENHLGVRLAQRSTRQLHLTTEGLAFLHYARQVLEAAERAELSVGPAALEVVGTLRVSAPYTFGRAFLAPLLPSFLERHPQVRVDLELGNRRVDVIGEDFDVAIRTGPLPDSNLVVRRLGTVQLELCAAPTYASPERPLRRPEDLSSHTVFDLSGTAERRWTLKRASEERVVVVAPRAAVNDPGALLELVMEGAGLAWIPAFLAEEPLAAGRLVRTLPDWTLPPAEINALYPSRKGLSPKVRAFLDAVAAASPSLPSYMPGNAPTVSPPPSRTKG